MRRKTLILSSDYLISSRIWGGGVGGLNVMHISEGEFTGYSDSTSLVDLCAIALTDYGG